MKTSDAFSARWDLPPSSDNVPRIISGKDQQQWSLILSPQAGFTLGVRRSVNSDSDWVKSEISDYLLEGPFKLVFKAMQDGNHIALVTNNKALRLSILNPLLSPWKEILIAKKIVKLLTVSDFSICTARDCQANNWFKAAALL